MSTSDLALFGGPRAVPEGLIKPWPEIRDEDKQAVMRVLDRGILWGAAGPEARTFEQEWADRLRIGYCLTSNSGTAALHMAVASVGIGPGDEVITTPFSWTSTATCILHHNAIPVFADIDPRTYNIDPQSIEERITPRTKAIIPVHLYGLAVDVDAILDIAQRHGLYVIEDCCQAHGAEYKGQHVGTFGHVAAFSLNGNKNLSAGEGGMLVTNDERIWQQAARLQQFGERRVKDGSREYNAYGMGWMYRTNEMSAAFARSQLSRLDETLHVIRENAAHLTSELDGSLTYQTPLEPPDRKHSFYRYSMLFTPERAGIDVPVEVFVQKVRAALSAEGVNVGRAEFVIPSMTLFQEQTGYGRGCPWTCQHYEGAVEYRAEDYPVALDTIKRLVSVIGLKPPNGRKLMDSYIAAFHKVFGSLDEVLEAQ